MSKPTVITEHVSDIPLLIEQMRHMQLISLIDKHFAPHGNWDGLTPGHLTVLWLCYILSEGDHRLNQVEEWAQDHLLTLRSCLSPGTRRLDASDDHLARLLDMLGNTENWEPFEEDCAQGLIRTYALEPQVNRTDSTTARSYGRVTADGLFQFGHSKDHRPDLPQVKINLTTLDPLGLPLVTQVYPGQSSDDPLYVPAIERTQACLKQSGLTHIGDSKMGALSTRAYVQHSGDYYLTPLALTQMSAGEIDKRLASVWSGQQPLTAVYRPAAKGTRREKIAEGFEWTESLTATVKEQACQWTERRFLMRSFKYATAQEKALRARLTQAQADLFALNQRGRGRQRYPTQVLLEEAVQTILTQYQADGLLKIRYEAQHTTRAVRAYGAARPARTEETADYFLRMSVNATALAHAIRRLGWRVYAANHPKRKLALAQAVDAYRHQYLEERGFGRLKGRALALTPLYLSNDQRLAGLIRLLSLGLRVLTLVEFEVRRQLQNSQTDLAGLYAGQPKRATTRPTTEQLLRAFKSVTLTAWRTGQDTWQTHLSPLSKTQQRILKLLKFPAKIYQRLEKQSLVLAPKMGEP